MKARAHELDGRRESVPLVSHIDEHRMRVLIAEDEPKTRELLMQMLRGWDARR